MTYQELEARCKNRNFDRIVVVVEDLYEEVEAMRRIMDEVPGDVYTCTDTEVPLLNEDGETVFYEEKRAVYAFANTEVCIVEPVKGDTLYQQYLERYGASICCVRERIEAARYDAVLAAYRDKGCRIAQQTAARDTAWLDLTEELGILFEVVSDARQERKPLHRSDVRIAQINVTTPDVKKTITKIADVLEIGPWEVGKQSNATNRGSAFRVDGELRDVPFGFHVAILPCGNIEWEAIEPVEGPLVYNDFLNRRGMGYHHILLEVDQARWQEVLKEYADKGIALSCKGSVGPVDWCYMDTEKALHFFTELRTDAPMTKLPDGYLEYFYPEKS